VNPSHSATETETETETETGTETETKMGAEMRTGTETETETAIETGTPNQENLEVITKPPFVNARVKTTRLDAREKITDLRRSWAHSVETGDRARITDSHK
jgi:hypothetical protein